MSLITQKAITPEGGEAEFSSVRFPRGWKARLDEAAKRRGMTRSELIRFAIEPLIADEQAPKEDAKAS